MNWKYDQNENKSSEVTTPRTITKYKYITDTEIYYYSNSCPFFHTYNDGEAEEVEQALLPFFRRFLLKIGRGHKISYNNLIVTFNDFLNKKGLIDDKRKYRHYLKCFTNFYNMLHPSKRYEVILPYFPYNYGRVIGNVEAVIRTKSGIRLYMYDFDYKNLDKDKLDFAGFRLQLAARIFKIKTGISPSSLALMIPYAKLIVYYSYNDNEKLETIIDNLNDGKLLVRRYGEHCACCLQKNCKPLIDPHDKYGWKEVEK